MIPTGRLDGGASLPSRFTENHVEESFMSEREESAGPAERPGLLFRLLEVAALLLGLIAVVVFLAELSSRDREAAPADRQSQPGTAAALPESGPPLQPGDLPYEFALAVKRAT
jgi:hypothetical protein